MLWPESSCWAGHEKVGDCVPELRPAFHLAGSLLIGSEVAAAKRAGSLPTLHVPRVHSLGYHLLGACGDGTEPPRENVGFF